MGKTFLTFLLVLAFPVFTSSQQTDKTIPKDVTVYVTKFGTKYHTARCSYLKGGGIPKKLSEISGYSPPAQLNVRSR